MQYRSPTRADINYSHVELSNDGEHWFPGGELEAMHFFGTRDRYEGALREGRYCRVPVHSPDPVAERLVAADMLADQGLDEAARVLMQFLAMDAITQNAFLAYRPGDSVTLYHTLLNELTPELAYTPNPPEPQL